MNTHFFTFKGGYYCNVGEICELLLKPLLEALL
jgi:hypothetical protein